MRNSTHPRAFTIVELLIVVVVIAVLAAISVVAYNGIQQRSRDARRAQDIASIKKVLLAYDTTNGSLRVPAAYAGSDNGGWDLSSIQPWLTFVETEYGKMPVDPINNLAGDPGGVSTTGYGYWYFCYNTGSGPNPASPNVRLGYVSERTNTRVHVDFPVQACT
jgi:prepilin-type N-terminal cleavage/methylation domain-containing protein